MKTSLTSPVVVNDAVIICDSVRVASDANKDYVMEQTCAENNQHHPFGPSTLERRSLCKLSYHEDKNLPEVKSEWADMGTDLHKQMAELIAKYTNEKGCLVAPDPDEIDTWQYELAVMFDRLLEIYCDNEIYSLGPLPEYPIHTEVALPLREVTGNYDAYGTADCIIVKKDRVAVIDWKTGRQETVDSSNNLQTAAYCVAAAKIFYRQQATAYIVNPHFRRDPGFAFTEEMLQYALSQIVDIVQDGRRADEFPDEYEYTPGEIQCKYCKASLLGTCPAIRMELEKIHTEVTKQEIPAAISAMTDDNLCEMKERCALVTKFIKAVDDEIKKRCKDTGMCGEYIIKETSGGREITDLQAAYQAVSSLITVDEFLKCCSLSVPAFRDTIAEKLKEKGDTKTKKGGQEIFDIELAPLINDKPPKQQLSKIKI